MYKILAIVPFFISCGVPTQARWNCNSGKQYYDYIDQNNESVRYKIDFDRNNAVEFKKVINAHEDVYRDTDIEFHTDKNLFSLGNIVVSSKIFDVDSWSHRHTACLKKNQYRQNDVKVAIVGCSENPSFGSVEYIFKADSGITALKSKYSNGQVESFSLVGRNGLAKFCQK